MSESNDYSGSEVEELYSDYQFRGGTLKARFPHCLCRDCCRRIYGSAHDCFHCTCTLPAEVDLRNPETFLAAWKQVAANCKTCSRPFIFPPTVCTGASHQRQQSPCHHFPLFLPRATTTKMRTRL